MTVTHPKLTKRFVVAEADFITGAPYNDIASFATEEELHAFLAKESGPLCWMDRGEGYGVVTSVEINRVDDYGQPYSPPAWRATIYFEAGPPPINLDLTSDVDYESYRAYLSDLSARLGLPQASIAPETEAEPVRRAITAHRVVLLDKALAEIREEALRAMGIHAPFNSAHEGYAVILEEVDELWDEVKADRGAEDSGRKEAVQVGSMACRYLVDVASGVRFR